MGCRHSIVDGITSQCDVVLTYTVVKNVDDDATVQNKVFKFVGYEVCSGPRI